MHTVDTPWPDGFEWDPAKDQKNIVERGLSFRAAARLWDNFVIEKADTRYDYGETRFIAVGVVDGTVLVVVYTWRGERRRIISARKANVGERDYLQEETEASDAGRNRLGPS